MVTVQNVGGWLYLIMQAEEKKCNNHIWCRKDFNQLYYQDVPDMCLPNAPRTASCWPVTTLIIFIFECSHVITLLPKGEKNLYPWQYPFSTSLPLISTSKHMRGDSLTAATPSLKNGFLPVCLCVAADNVPPCIFVSVCFSQKLHFWEMAGVLPALCTLASSHFCLCEDFHR